MKKFLLLSFFSLAIVFAAVTTGNSKKTKPPVAKTGAPTSEATCGSNATGCHNTTPNSGSGTLTVDFGQTTYSAGQVLTATVATSETGMAKFGFEGTMLDGTNTKAGTLAIINSANTSLQTSGGREYIGHQSASANNSWTFNWTAPSAGVGPVTFYLTSICGDGNDHSSNDHCYQTNLVLEEVSNSINEVSNENDFLILENTIADNFSLKYSSTPNTNTIIRVIDLNGRVVNTLVNQLTSGTHFLSFTKPSVAGIYFVDYRNGNNHVVKKLVVM